MIKLKNISIKNFLSVGNSVQAVNFDTPGMTLVLGNNLDLGGDGSRNGTGKTTIINALSYVIYGIALNNIRRDNLINKTNGKNMIVTVEFDKDGHSYRIERGRKPNIFKFICDDAVVNDTDTNEAQGDSRLTQQEVERIFGMSHLMFKHIVALNTYNEPLLAMKAGDQREVIEELLGITKLSEKAGKLRDEIKSIKDDITREEARIDTVKRSNSKVEDTIRKFRIKLQAWDDAHEKRLVELRSSIAQLNKVNIDEEIDSHELLVKWNQDNTTLQSLKRELTQSIGTFKQLDSSVQRLKNNIATLEDKRCPTCDQALHNIDEHDQILKSAKKELAETENQSHTTQTQIQTTYNSIQQLLSAHTHTTNNTTHTSSHTNVHTIISSHTSNTYNIGAKPSVYYNTMNEAYQHRQNLEALQSEEKREQTETNPIQEQIDELQQKNIEVIDYATINSLTSLKEHQEFLYRLLTSKDSFIRKKIIDQNLNYLNSRLNHYLDTVGLPHEVVFQSDLTVMITELGRELDFDNLSRGERNRLILGLSWAFRDVFETTSNQLNLLFIDELIDSGMDTQGVESAIAVLKKMGRERNKNVFLISHRDELIGRVTNILNVIKEHGFTTFDNDLELVGNV